MKRLRNHRVQLPWPSQLPSVPKPSNFTGRDKGKFGWFGNGWWTVDGRDGHGRCMETFQNWKKDCIKSFIYFLNRKFFVFATTPWTSSPKFVIHSFDIRPSFVWPSPIDYISRMATGWKRMLDEFRTNVWRMSNEFRTGWLLNGVTKTKDFLYNYFTDSLSFLKRLLELRPYIINGEWFRRRFKNERSTLLFNFWN